MYSQLASAFKVAYLACSRVTTMNRINKTKWFTKELKIIKSKMLKIRYIKNKTEENIEELKLLKRDFRKIVKKNIYLYEKNEYFKLENLIKSKNGDEFFKKINKVINKENDIINLQNDTLVDHFFNIFNRPLNVSNEVIESVEIETQDISHSNYSPISINISDLTNAINMMQSSNVCGNDEISSKMIKNCNSNFINNKLLFFFKFIFYYGVIPDEFNITHIIPIKKDKTKDNNDLSNLRPISITNALAQIFERILMSKISLITNTNDFQFGYKNKTSCTNALFVFKESVLHNIEKKNVVFAVFLDAIKAFDNLWRQALYLKMKKHGFSMNTIILLKTYYDKLASKIKVNNSFSKLFTLSRGVKQGGYLSGSLFNFYINDLIEECHLSGAGIAFIDMIISIIVFCDDICLLSLNLQNMQLLLRICENFSKKWALEFNTMKCKFIVFGSNKFNNSSLLLNNSELSFTSNIKYLGLEFNANFDMSNFFLNKFNSVSKSFFSLNAFGFKPAGINPYLQSFIYKSFCISRLLYGLEIMTLNKKILSNLNIRQNNIIRYMTGLSKNSHISNTRMILKILSINELYIYMKLIFVKNLKNNSICQRIFNNLLNVKHKDNTKSFIKEFKDICNILELNYTDVINNINEVTKNYKEKCLQFEVNTETDLIIECLNNHHDVNMIYQLNLITYAGPLYNIKNV